MKQLIVFSVIMIAVAACEPIFNDPDNSDDPGDRIKPRSVASLNIEDADYLALKNSNTQSTGSSDWSNLYKLVKLDDGLVTQVVRFRDNDNTPIDSVFTSIHVDNIYPVSEEYICITGNFEIQVDSTIDKLVYTSLLVRISDGTIYDFNGHIPGGYYLGAKYLLKDNLDNRYYSYSSAIYKLAGLSTSVITQETYVSSSQYRNGGFFISPAGDCFFGNTKIKLSTGGIILAERWFKNLFSANGRIYAALNQDLYEVTISGDSSSFQLINQIHIPIEFYTYYYSSDGYDYLIGSINGDYGIQCAGLIYRQSDNKLYELSLPAVVNSSGFNLEDLADNYLWISSISNIEKQIYRFNLDEFNTDVRDLGYGTYVNVAMLNSYDLIAFPDTIEVYSYRILDYGGIAFTGYDLPNELEIAGILDHDNELLLTDSSSDYSFTILLELD